MELLLQNRALPNVQTTEGKTPLHYSTEEGRVDVSRMVLFYDGDPSIRCESGKSAFDVAAENGRKKVKILR